MKTFFKDLFFRSLIKMGMYETWWYKIYDFIKYKIPRFFKNIWLFKKELIDFQSWDYSFNEQIFKRSLELTANYLEKYGFEEDVSRNKKILAIRRVIKLLQNEIDDNFLEQAEDELNSSYICTKLFDDQLAEADMTNNKMIVEKAIQIQEDQWTELWSIIKGNFKFSKGDDWDEVFNGSDMRGWWD